MTRIEIIETIMNRNKKRPWVLQAQARKYRDLKKYGGPQRSRARRDSILKTQYHVQGMVVRMHDPAASSATSPYQARRSVLHDLAHSTDDPRKTKILNNIIRYGAREPVEPEDDFF